MNMAKIYKIMRLASAAGIDLSGVEDFLSDERLNSWLQTYLGLRDLYIDPDDLSSIRQLADLVGLDLGDERISAVAKALREEGVGGPALDFILNGQALRVLLTRDGGGKLNGEWVRDESGEPKFVSKPVL